MTEIRNGDNNGLRKKAVGIVLSAVAPQKEEARATVPHEVGAQPSDGAMEGGRYDDQRAVEWRDELKNHIDATQGESPLIKFARLWDA
jgi:hypothetical protein